MVDVTVWKVIRYCFYFILNAFKTHIFFHYIFLGRPSRWRCSVPHWSCGGPQEANSKTQSVQQWTSEEICKACGEKASKAIGEIGPQAAFGWKAITSILHNFWNRWSWKWKTLRLIPSDALVRSSSNRVELGLHSSASAERSPYETSSVGERRSVSFKARHSIQTVLAVINICCFQIKLESN